ncbi:hypothetical protein HK100_002506, partial [Physocladia obscura]
MSAIGNPGPLGLSAFALTTFVLSLYNIEVLSITNTAPVIGLAIFYGGAVQILAGQWEFAAGNTFGATAFTSYGGFWLSFAAIFIPGFNILGSYDTDTIAQLPDALGIYLTGWLIFTFILFIASFRSNVGTVALFGFLTITFLFLALSKFVTDADTSLHLQKAGGAFGVITAFIAWYNAAHVLITSDSSFVDLPNPSLKRGA